MQRWRVRSNNQRLILFLGNFGRRRPTSADAKTSWWGSSAHGFTLPGLFSMQRRGSAPTLGMCSHPSPTFPSSACVRHTLPHSLSLILSLCSHSLSHSFSFSHPHPQAHTPKHTYMNSHVHTPEFTQAHPYIHSLTHTSPFHV